MLSRSSSRFALSLSLVSLALIAGCTERGEARPDGGGGGADSATPPSPIRIEPADEVRSIEGAPVVIDYRAFLTTGGSEREVTTEVSWSSTVPALGAMEGARFTSVTDRGGRTEIRASMGGIEGRTSLMLRLARTVVTPGTPADAPARFDMGTDDPSRAPELVYPEDGTMVPPNLGELEFHYRTGGFTLFELHVMAPAVDLRVYFGCPEPLSGGCAYTPDREVWESIATAASGTGPFEYRLRGIDSSGRIGATATRTLVVSEEPITGGLYYWNAAAGTINRFEFGVEGAVEERYLDTGRTGAAFCVGCHVLSRDGTRIGVSTDIPTSTFQVFDVASRTRMFMRGMGGTTFPTEPNFYSFSPDSSQIVASSLAGLRIHDANTGEIVLSNLGGGAASMPDWSPDGDHIVYVRHDAPPIGGLVDSTGVQSGRIHRLDRDGTGWREGPLLVSSRGDNNYYPAYSPDGQWVIFVRSPSNSNSMGSDMESGGADGVRDAELWIVAADASGQFMRLSNVTGLADSWPKWDPTEYRDRGRPLFWVAWSSRRAFGLRLPEDTRVQLWMAAFDPTAPGEGREPAFPAFRLPFQNLESGNHIAQWVTSVERQTCDEDADCGGEFCIDGRCYEEPPLI